MKFKLNNTTRLLFTMALIIVYFFVELVTGHLINSLSLVADSFHMLSDFFALSVGVAFMRISKWPRSAKNTFGWQRAEVMGSLINTVILVTFCFTILISAIERYIDPKTITNPQAMVFVGAGGLIINIFGLLIVGVHSHSHDNNHGINAMAYDNDAIGLEMTSCQNENRMPLNEGNGLNGVNKSSEFNIDIVDDKEPSRKRFGCLKKRCPSNTNLRYSDDDEHENCHLSYCPATTKKHSSAGLSMNMKAIFLHVLADFFGSIIVLISALILWKVPGDPTSSKHKWKLYIDPSMSIIMVGIILCSAIPLLKKAALILLQSVPNEVCIRNIKSRMERLEGVVRVHDLHVWKLQSNCIIGTVHIRCRSLLDYMSLVRQVKQLFHEYNVHCTTIQPEFEDSLYGRELGENSPICLFDCGPNMQCNSDSCCPLPVSQT